MVDAIVVGAGIIGTTIAEALRKHMQVLVIDAHKPMSGTKPSGGHLKESWFGGMKKEEYEPAMQLLDEIWGLKVEEFYVSPVGAKTKVYRVDTDKVYTKHIVGEVVEYGATRNGYEVIIRQGTKGAIYQCTYLVFATGAFDVGWLGKQQPSIKSKQGISFRMKGKLSRPFINPWAPYKQVVAHQQTPDSIWIGDGSAILEANWDEDRTQSCLVRCNKALGKKLVVYRENPPDPLEHRMGLRAYCDHSKSDPCLFQQLGSNVFLVTGAGKSGTISAGWSARKILQHVGAI